MTLILTPFLTSQNPKLNRLSPEQAVEYNIRTIPYYGRVTATAPCVADKTRETLHVYSEIAAAEAVIVFALASAVFGLVEVNVKNAGMKTKTVPVYLAIFLLSQ
ncbi:hypothetical protein LQV05_006233 [Cryptococcus neoformans]|nr:hypothetical protein LQV05_006233 [Cryptococcus neoformans]